MKKERENLKTVVVAGGFATIHNGHKKLFDKANHLKKEKKLKLCVFTFDDSLEKFKSGKVFWGIEKRTIVLKELGADDVFIQSFDEKFKSLSPRDFVTEILLNKLNAGAVVVGENFRFGKDACGTATELKNICGKYGIDVYIVELEKTPDGKIISTSLLRELASNGDVKSIYTLSGRPFEIKGTVISGRGEGHSLGSPTANIAVEPDAVLPALGVYVSAIKVDGKIYGAVTNIGTAPTFEVDKVLAETHLIDFEGDLYGKEVTVYLLKKLRDIVKFKTPEELIKQIEVDKNNGIEYINGNKEKLSIF